jgi:hypothetical protein
LGGQKLAESLVGGGFMKNPMGLLCRLFKRTLLSASWFERSFLGFVEFLKCAGFSGEGEIGWTDCQCRFFLSWRFG